MYTNFRRVFSSETLVLLLYFQFQDMSEASGILLPPARATPPPSGSTSGAGGGASSSGGNGINGNKPDPELAQGIDASLHTLQIPAPLPEGGELCAGGATIECVRNVPP